MAPLTFRRVDLTFPRTVAVVAFLVAGFFAAEALAAVRTVGFSFVAVREALAPPEAEGFLLGAAGFLATGIGPSMRPRCVGGKKSCPVNGREERKICFEVCGEHRLWSMTERRADQTRVVVVGASGYSGEELLRLLAGHERVEVVGVTSRQHAGHPLGELLPRFRKGRLGGLLFCDSTVDAIIACSPEVVFLALPHGLAAEFAVPLLEAGLCVIDLSADFRLRSADLYREFYGEEHPAPQLLEQAVYGLPEVYRERIRTARLIASPGCYPTSLLLPLIPLLREELIDPSWIVAVSMSGVSGAGRKADPSLLFAECNESVRAYGIPKHRHLSEIEQELSLAAGTRVTISFAPHLIPVTRGIASCIHTLPRPGVTPDQICRTLERFYQEEPFVRLLGSGFPDTKHVLLTNFCDIGWQWDERTGRLVLCSAEDNLCKGAASQAVQSMNIRCSHPETMGLL
ncbi:MAG: N-acetyl-gamma-glutamyl-phosphate reductase [Verrucomicrobiia bacterium]